MRRGVRDVRLERPYDTVLALMNGVATAGTLAGLIPLFATLAGFLVPGGRLLVDSTDLRRSGGRGDRRGDGRYVGKLQHQLLYDGERGSPFPQLFVDPARLAEAAHGLGLRREITWRGRSGAYLASIVRP